MSSLNNIDELLKEGFKDFTPDAPDVWSNINTQLSTHSQMANAAGQAGTVIKSASIVTKIVLAVVVVPAAFAGIYFGYRYFNQPAAVSFADTRPMPAEQLPDNPLAAIPEANEVREGLKQADGGPRKVISRKESIKKQVFVENAEAKTDPTESITDKIPVAPAAIVQPQLNPVPASPDPKALPVTKKEGAVSSLKNMADYTEEIPRQEQQDEKDASAQARSTDIIIHNAFSPDNDGKNDKFVIPVESMQSYTLKISDRQGNKVFESSSKTEFWDGTDARTGQPCESGGFGYPYSIIYIDAEGVKHSKSGIITLIR